MLDYIQTIMQTCQALYIINQCNIECTYVITTWLITLHVVINKSLN